MTSASALKGPKSFLSVPLHIMQSCYVTHKALALTYFLCHSYQFAAGWSFKYTSNATKKQLIL